MDATDVADPTHLPGGTPATPSGGTGRDAIAVTNLSKTYRFHRKEPGLLGSVKSLFRRQTLETQAVEDVSFTIRAGEIVGFLGPNGAGKTTTLKLLCGLLYPSAGSVSVLGHTPHRREPAFLRRITLLMGQRSMLWRDLPAMDTFLMHKVMYGVPDAVFRRTVDQLAALLEVGHLLRVQTRKLSLGERMKMELIAALVHQPDVLFLDEPTLGLDVVSQQRVRDFLRRLNQVRGTTVLLTSHYMADIEALCPRVLLVDHGRLKFDGPLESLVRRVSGHKLVRAVYAAPPSLGTLPPGWTLQPEADPLRVSLSAPRDQVPDVTELLLRAGRLVDLSVQEPPIEDVIRTIFGGASDTPKAPPGETQQDVQEGQEPQTPQTAPAAQAPAGGPR